MKVKKCKECGSIEYGIWGTIGVIGYSLIVALLGYVFSQIFYDDRIIGVVCLGAVILMLPLWFISYQNKELEE